MSTDNLILQDKRDSIRRAYKSTNGIIFQPGKFEGEPIFAPYYWEMGLDGLADEDTHDGYAYILAEADFKAWPELADQGFKLGDELHLRVSETGFVYCY